jgi:hypothetical protein
MAIAPSGVRAVRTAHSTTWADTRWGGGERASGTLYHLAVCDALQHHLCCSDPCLELLGLVLRLELDKVPGVVAAVPLDAVGSGGSPRLAPGTREGDPHVPQCASGLGDLPLAVVGHEADLRVLAATVVVRADLPPGGSPGRPSSACPWPPATAGRGATGTTGP